MNSKSFYIQLRELNEEYHKAPLEREIASMLAIEDFFKEQLKLEPHNIEVWLRLARLELIPPLQNPEMIIACLDKILEYDPQNSDALIFITYVHNIFSPEIPIDIFLKLCKLKLDNQDKAAMVELVKALYYKERKNDLMYEKCLLTAIDFCPTFASHYFDLGKLYAQQGFKEEARMMITRSLNNLKHVYTHSYFIEDITDIEVFYNQYLRGTHVSTLKVFEMGRLFYNTEKLTCTDDILS